MSSAEDRIRTYAFLDPKTGAVTRVRTCRPSERLLGVDPATPCVEAPGPVSFDSHTGVMRDGAWTLVETGPASGAASGSPFAFLNLTP